NLSGIDIDWEFPSSPRANEKEGITKLAGILKEILPESVILSITLSRWRLPDQELFNIADEIHLMAYDGYGKHSTSESAIADSEIVLTRYNLSPEKLILGLPFYGRNYNPESEGYWKDTKNYGEIIREYSPGPDEDTTNDFFFNGRTTIIKKTNWALTRGLGGVFVWEPFYDADGYESLTDAILQTMIRN
ncbi:MAG: glycoside hydrolase family 18 protein, partial [Spirochaetaceae bacterium]|nr:glycoside hydrolase family 18 protein [Spirochaetaceae bacterium]